MQRLRGLLPGSKAAGDGQGKGAPASARGKKAASSDAPGWRISLFTIFLIFAAVYTIPLIMMFLYYYRPKLVIAAVVVLFVSGNAPLLTISKDSEVWRNARGPLFACSISLCCALAAVGGIRNYYNHVLPIHDLWNLPSAHFVYPQQPAVIYTDTSFLDFSPTTRVDSTKAVNFKSLRSALETYCVAPVVDEMNEGLIQFWAVGVDCCSQDVGTFDCGDAADPSAHHGWVLQEVDPDDYVYERLGKHLVDPNLRRDLFLEAIAKAEKVHGLVTGEDPVLLRWTAKSSDDLKHDEIRAIIWSLFYMAFASLVAAIFLALMFINYRPIQKLTEKMLESAEGGNLEVTRVPALIGQSVVDFVREQQRYLEHRKLQPSLEFTEMCVTGVVVPFVVMMMLAIIWAFSFCSSYGPTIIAPFMILVAMYVISQWMRPYKLWQGSVTFFAAVAGSYIGYRIYTTNVFHYCAVEHRRIYSDVLPDADGAEYLDAGKVSFASSARVNANWSVGLLFEGKTYCAAPVIPECALQGAPPPANAPPAAVGLAGHRHREVANSKWHGLAAPALLTVDAHHGVACPQPSNIDFWAVGTDCCDSRNRFTCDGAGNAGARSAVVFHDMAEGEKEEEDDEEEEENEVGKAVGATGTEEEVEAVNQELQRHAPVNDFYLKAVRASTQFYGLPPPKHPLLIRLGTNAEELQQQWLNRAIVSLVLLAVVGCLALVAVAFGTYYFVKRLRREEAARQQKQQANQGKTTTV